MTTTIRLTKRDQEIITALKNKVEVEYGIKLTTPQIYRAALENMAVDNLYTTYQPLETPQKSPGEPGQQRGE